MVTPELINFIKQRVEGGASKDAISAELAGAGWMQEDVVSAFAALFPTAPVVTPEMPVSTPRTFSPTPIEEPKKRLLVAGLVGGAVFLVVVGVAYGLIASGVFSGAPFTEKNFITGVAGKAADIHSASYTLGGTFSVVPREATVKPFVLNIPNNEERIAKFQRDYERMVAISNSLYELKKISKTYPTQLSWLKVGNRFFTSDLNDPLTHQPYPYSVKNSARDFDLSVTFETPEALATIKEKKYTSSNKENPPVVNGQTVTFSKDSSSSFYLPSRPPETFFESLVQEMKMLPGELKAKVFVSFAAKKNNEGRANESVDWKGNIDIAGDFGDLTYKVNIDSQKNGDIFYARVNNIPSLFGINIPKDIWIKIDPKDAPEGMGSWNVLTSSAMMASSSGSVYQKHQEESKFFVEQALKAAESESLFAFETAGVKETVNKEQLFRYNLKFKKDSFSPFYKKLSQALAGKTGAPADFFKDISPSDLETQDVKDVLAYLETNSFMTVWVDKAGYPRVFEWVFKVAPPDEVTALKDKQAVLTLRLELRDINTTIAIDPPANAKPLQEVFPNLFPAKTTPQDTVVPTGSPLADARMKGIIAAMKANLASIRAQAELVYDRSNGYGTKAFPLGKCSKMTGTLFGDSQVYALLGQATSKNVARATCGTRAGANGHIDTYVIMAPYPDNSGYSWCVDSTGSSKEVKGTFRGYSCADVR